MTAQLPPHENGQYQAPPRRKKDKSMGCCCGGCLGAVGLMIVLAVVGGYYAINRLFPTTPLEKSDFNFTEADRTGAKKQLDSIRQSLSVKEGAVEVSMSARELNILCDLAMEENKGVEVLDFAIDGETLSFRFSGTDIKEPGRYLNITFKGKISFENNILTAIAEEMTFGEIDLANTFRLKGRDAGKELEPNLLQALANIRRDKGIDIKSAKIEDGRIKLKLTKVAKDSGQKETEAEKKGNGLDT